MLTQWRFILETVRAFGILQIDLEPALKALMSEVTSEVAGLAVRHSPKGWKQAQVAMVTLQSPVTDDADLGDFPEIDQLPKRPLEEVTGSNGAQSSKSRPRLLPPPTLERKREISEVSESAS